VSVAYVPPPGAASPPAVPMWMHRETDPAAGAALALSLAEGPPAVARMDTPTRIHALRCLTAMTVYACQEIQGPDAVPAPGPVGEGPTRMLTLGNLSAARYPSREACYAASTLARSMILIPDPGVRPVYSCVTVDGEPAQFGARPTEPQEAANPLLIAGVVIAGVALCCVAAVYIAGTVANAINVDRKMEADTDSARIISAQAGVMSLLHEHAEEQRLAGKPLPWDPVVMGHIKALDDLSHDIATRQRAPWPIPFPGAVDALGHAGGSIAGSLTTVALVLGTAFVLSR
jgi:hypothetical protein